MDGGRGAQESGKLEGGVCGRQGQAGSSPLPESCTQGGWVDGWDPACVAGMGSVDIFLASHLNHHPSHCTPPHTSTRHPTPPTLPGRARAVPRRRHQPPDRRQPPPVAGRRRADPRQGAACHGGMCVPQMGGGGFVWLAQCRCRQVGWCALPAPLGSRLDLPALCLLSTSLRLLSTPIRVFLLRCCCSLTKRSPRRSSVH